MIIPVKQQGDSDCLCACLASLTGIPLAAFPTWTMGDTNSAEQHNGAQRVLHAHGWTLLNHFYPPRIPAGWSVGSGKSPRGDWWHSVVCFDGRPVFDPHPSGLFLAEPVQAYQIIVRLVQPFTLSST